MAEQTYAITHIVGTSATSIDEAIRSAVRKAGETIRNLDWFEVEEIRGHLGTESEVKHFQVTVKLGFRVDD